MHKLLATLTALALAASIHAASFSGTFTAVPSWSYSTNYGPASASASFPAIAAIVHTYGTNANQMTDVCVISGTLAAGTTSTVHMATDLIDPFGKAVSIARVRFLSVESDSDNYGALTVGGAATDAFEAAFSGVVTVRPGGCAIFAAPDLTGYAIGTTTNLQFANTSASNITYSVIIGGSN